MNDVISNDGQKCAEALAALHDVIDPEIGLNIVDLGLVYQIDFDEGNKLIYVSMTLTTQYCPMGDSIRDAALTALEQGFPEYGIELQLVFDPPWSSARISDEGQHYLNR
jgi:metal-sulfur cluster biosynthetic enzyme